MTNLIYKKNKKMNLWNYKYVKAKNKVKFYYIDFKLI